MRRKFSFNRTGWLIGFPLILAAAGLFLAAGPVAAQEKTTFARSLPAGNYSVSQEYFFSLIVTVAQTSQTAQEKVKFLWNMRVDEPNGGEPKSVHLAIRHVFFQAQDKRRLPHTLIFDSEYSSIASPVMRAFYDNLRAADIRVCFDGPLNVTKISGLESLRTTLDETASDDTEAAIFLSVVKNVLNDAALSEMFSQMFYLLPAEAVQVGDRWTNETSIALPVLGKTPVQWETQWKKTESFGSDLLATLSGKCQIPFDESTTVNVSLDGVYDLTSGLNLELTSRAVVSKKETVAVGGENQEVKTVGMVRGIQKISPVE